MLGIFKSPQSSKGFHRRAGGFIKVISTHAVADKWFMHLLSDEDVWEYRNDSRKWITKLFTTCAALIVLAADLTRAYISRV